MADRRSVAPLELARRAPRRFAALSALPFLRLRETFRGRRGPLAFLAVVGPGLIAGVAGNDAGGITTYATLGSSTGLRFLWILPFTALLLALVQESVARLGVVTGQGLTDLIREHFGVRWTLFAMIILLIANLANTVANVAGASSALAIFGAPTLLTAPLAALAVWLIVVYGNYHSVERIFLSLTAVFLAYIAAALLANPNWAEVASSLTTPDLGGISATEALLLVAVVGTTVTPYMQFYLQSAVAEKEIGVEELGAARADAILGSAWTNFIAVCIVIATAVALAGSGQAISSAAEAATALEPLAGTFSTILFGAGLFGASLLAMAIMPLTTAFALSEAFGFESGVDKKLSEAPIFYGIFTVILVIGAGVVMIPGLDPIGAIVGSQYLQGLFLPIVLAFIVKLASSRVLLGAHASPRWLQITGWAAVVLLFGLNAAVLVANLIGVGA
jgi:NRAMP (natural resistance-associated macrophage protein)-like metal ion transporter